MRFFSDFLYKSICCGYSFASTHNICLCKEVERKYICCNVKTTELLDCALKGVCVVIKSNTVCSYVNNEHIHLTPTPSPPSPLIFNNIYMYIRNFFAFMDKRNAHINILFYIPSRKLMLRVLTRSASTRLF